MATNDNDFLGELCYKYYCDNCNYKTIKKSSFKNHTQSKKHQNNLLTIYNMPKKYDCKICERFFNDRAGLWRHKKKCVPKIVDDDDDDENFYEGINIKDKDALVMHLLKQNGELQKSLIEMSKIPLTNNTISNNDINNNSNNTTNNAFNLNFYLNETCKDAMNITDFVSSIKVSLDDLENTGKKGYIEGISSIILKNLNKLKQGDRPLHCSDQKREVIYIRDNNQWIKETDDKPILTKAIKTIAGENIKQISVWRELYPDCTYADSKKNNTYLKIVSNSMCGIDKEETERNLSKIISNVARVTAIQKDM
jgi:hypothetical protein